MVAESKPRIAIVDDDGLIVESFADEFSDEFMIAGFTSPMEALEASRLQQMEVIIADFRMPELDGISFLTGVKQRRPNLTRILFTAYADLDCLSRAINEAGIFHYIAKDSLGRPGKHSDFFSTIRSGGSRPSHLSWESRATSAAEMVLIFAYSLKRLPLEAL
jgi:response regulator RpfG family c-di-GMP phosphodiesterase